MKRIRVWFKLKLRHWICPEYDQVVRFMVDVEAAKKQVLGDNKNVTLKEPVIWLGSLVNCKVNVKPTIKPEIILSRFAMDSALRLMGEHHIVTGCIFKEEHVVDARMPDA